MVKHQKFLLGSDTFYMVDDMKNIVVPDNADFKSSAIQSTINDKTNHCDISIYQYHDGFVSEENCQRVQSFKDFIISEKLTQIDNLNNDFIITIDYDLYNNEGKILSSGSTSIKSKIAQAIINADVDELNHLNYRKGLLCDSCFEIQIPRVSRYGIKNKYDQHPYVIKFNSITVSSTIGDYSHIIESNTQENCRDHHYSNHVDYEFHRPCPRLLNNHATHFLTNAKVGTTIIDQTVVPTRLEIPPKYTEVEICKIDLPENQYKIKINHKIDIIMVSLEVLVDNILEVYDINDIIELLKLNTEEDKDDIIIPDPEIPEEEIPNEPVNPDDTGNNETTNPDNNESEILNDNGSDNSDETENDNSNNGENNENTTDPEIPEEEIPNDNGSDNSDENITDESN